MWESSYRVPAVYCDRVLTHSGGLVSSVSNLSEYYFFFQAEDGIRDSSVTGVQTCALPIFMSSNPHPILIVSSESREGAEVTLKALQLGAIDFVPKPTGGVDLDMSSVKEEICRKLRMAGKVRVVRTATRSKLQHDVATSSPRTEPAASGFGQRSGQNGRPPRAAPAPAPGAGESPPVGA